MMAVLDQFQFTPLREGRPRFPMMQHLGQRISIHAPPRGATALAVGVNKTRKFQFTPLREGRRGLTSGAIWHIIIFQFTPLREGRLIVSPRYMRLDYISIHAPPRGATMAFDIETTRLEDISIHAPPRGATDFRVMYTGRVNISIHAPPRGATSAPSGVWLNACISIHAPPRGATSTRLFRMRTNYNFNSRPSARGDGCRRSGIIVYTIFQFTPLREGRRRWQDKAARVLHFNSRPSARGDAYKSIKELDGRVISIHAPPRGATVLPVALL